MAAGLKRVDVTVEIPTKDRYDSLLLCLMSIANQTYIPNEVLIYDNGERKDLREDILYGHLFSLFNQRGIEWKVLYGEEGLVANRALAMKEAKNDWIFRVDDDTIMEADVIERLVHVINENDCGAVAPSILLPNALLPPSATSDKMEDVFLFYALQFAPFAGVKETEFLYSAFLYNRNCAKDCYPLDLSPVAHREDTRFSHNIFRNGHKLLAVGDVYMWHFRKKTGGIRCYDDEKLWNSDEEKFFKYLRDNNIKIAQHKHAYINGGRGDNYIFRKVLDKYLNKYPNDKFVIGTVYPEIYEEYGDRVKTCDLKAFQIILFLDEKKVQAYDPYKLMTFSKEKMTVEEAYTKIYTEHFKW